MLKLYVRCCSAMLLDLCPKVLSPKILSRFWRAMLGPFGGQMEGSKGLDWAKFGHFGYLEATALLLWGQVGLSGGHVEAKLGYVYLMSHLSRWSYMSDFVRPCCWFCIQKCSPPAGPRFWMDFCKLCWLHLGKYGYLVAMSAPLARSWDQLWPSRGPWWGYVGWVRGIQRHRQKPPQTKPPKRSPPWPSWRNRITKNHPKNKISSNANPHGKGRPNASNNHPKMHLPKINPHGRDGKT